MSIGLPALRPGSMGTGQGSRAPEDRVNREACPAVQSRYTLAGQSFVTGLHRYQPYSAAMKPILASLAGALALGSSLLLGAADTPAQAGLGQPVASVSADQTRMKGQLRARVGVGYTVEEITMPSGTLVKEFVSPSGIIFAVSWRGPTMPNLAQALGSQYFSQLTAAEKSQRFGRNHVEVRNTDFVVHAGGHMRSFYGMAYVPSLLPPNVSLSNLH